MLADANNTSKYAKSASFCAPLGGTQSYGQVGMSHASSMRSIPVTMPAVTNIRTVSGLPYGLTEKAIAAAHQIKFVPATKDGHQVSMWMQLEYNFNLY